MITVSSRSTLLALAAAALLPSAPALAQTPGTTPSPTAAPSPSTTPSPTPVGITIDADRTVIDAGQTVSVAVYGQVGALVGLYGTAGGRPARLIRSGTLARSEGGDVGVVVFSGLQPGETTTFSADVGLRDSPSVRTGPLTVRVRRTVTIGIRQDVQGIYTFTGQVARAEPGLQVTIARLASGTNEVTGVASTTTDAAGRYALRTPLPPGMSGYYALTGVNRSSLDPGRSRLYGLLVEPVAAPAHAVAPRSGAQPVPRPADVDCRDFRTQRAAQAFYDRYVGRFGDFARLDGDDDGRACEALP